MTTSQVLRGGAGTWGLVLKRYNGCRSPHPGGPSRPCPSGVPVLLLPVPARRSSTGPSGPSEHRLSLGVSETDPSTSLGPEGDTYSPTRRRLGVGAGPTDTRVPDGTERSERLVTSDQELPVSTRPAPLTRSYCCPLFVRPSASESLGGPAGPTVLTKGREMRGWGAGVFLDSGLGPGPHRCRAPDLGLGGRVAGAWFFRVLGHWSGPSEREKDKGKLLE